MNQPVQRSYRYENFLNLDVDELMAQTRSGSEGISDPEAKIRLKQFGANTIKAQQIKWWQILGRQFRSPFIYLLIGAAVLALALGEWIDGLMILLFVVINAGLGFFQEYRSEQALKVLKKYTTAQAKVLRSGKESSLRVTELVPGDIVLLQPGDIVPADIRLIEANSLLLDESVLTGESEPVIKTSTPLAKPEKAVHKANNMAFSATNVISGEGKGVVVATADQAYIGAIAKLTVETHRVSSFEKGMNKFSTFVLRLVSVTLFIVFFANLMIKGGSTNIGDMIIFSIALATAVIPEALPLVITFSLSRGAVRLAKHHVVVKRLSAIEDLGGIEVLCTDKTGTITQNKLTVVDVFGDREEVLWQANAAINPQNPHPDPFDTALAQAWKAMTAKIRLPKLVRELPFDPNRKRNSVLVEDGDKYRLIVRGAAETILPFVKKGKTEELETWIEQQGKTGKRVIVVAHKPMASGLEYTQEAEEADLILEGAVAFVDPLKQSTPAAVKKAQDLGVTIKIITGDSAAVAGAVATEIGLVNNASEVITAEEFFKLNLNKQKLTAEKMNVFARFSPAQKHQLIDVLQHKFEVGFLGEGINDAPALKSANVALVVQGASDIAREAADVILLNSSLNVIIDGIQEGREVFANTIKYVKMTLASNFGNFYAVAIASLVIDYLPMLPIQILLVNLLSDFPLIAVAADSVDVEEIKSPESYNLREFALVATILGVVSSVFDFIYFGLFYRISPEVLQTNWFMGSIITELLLLYSLRTRLPFFKAKFPPAGILILTGLAGLAAVVIPMTAFGQGVFRFAAPSMTHLGIVFGVAAVYFVATEAVKLMYYRVFQPGMNGSESK